MARYSYVIPRDTKGEGRILMIFSVKALIYTGVGAAIGFVVQLLLSMCGLKNFIFTVICLVLFGGIGFIIGTFKVPETTAFKFTQKVGGENIDDIILRAIKFKANKNKIYVYDVKGETKDE